jgi:hypothetical protein
VVGGDVAGDLGLDALVGVDRADLDAGDVERVGAVVLVVAAGEEEPQTVAHDEPAERGGVDLAALVLAADVV